MTSTLLSHRSGSLCEQGACATPTRADEPARSTHAAKTILNSRHARTHIARGLNALEDAVYVTLGPRGRDVVLGRDGGVPVITTDGDRDRLQARLAMITGGVAVINK